LLVDIIFLFHNTLMKLATYQDGSKDGQLVVVSRDQTLAHYATGICSTMRQLLDDWNFLSPQLQDLYDALNRQAGQSTARHAFAFDAARCMAPLPRIYQWATQEGKKLVRQPGGDGFVCFAGDIPASELGLAYLTADVPEGASPAHLRDGLRLAVQIKRQMVAPEILFTPVACTLDEIASGAIA
jgi:fumarylacetoacetate (FAA) hydrolase